METGRMELHPAGEHRWTLTVRDTGEECGRCGMQKIQWNKKTLWEISWELTPEYLHQGYAAEAVRALTDYAFSQPGVEEVCALVPDTDQPGIAARPAQRHDPPGKAGRPGWGGDAAGV